MQLEMEREVKALGGQETASCVLLRQKLMREGWHESADILTP